jgi:hypothetical protein
MRHGVGHVLAVVVSATGVGVWTAGCGGQPSRGRPDAASATPAPPAASALDIRLPDAIAGWTASAPAAIYDPESIYSYIDGHAEVYRAYGMKRCVSRRFSGPAGEADIVADVFELASPEDAYGMFTHDRDGEPADIGRDSLFRHGWLSFWKGPYFVSIVAEGDSQRARQGVLEAGRAIAAVLPDAGAPPALVSALPAKDLDPHSLRFLRHPQILNTHVFVSDDNVLGLAPDTAVALGTYRRQSGRAFLLLAEYPDDARATSAAERFRSRMLAGTSGDRPVAIPDRGFFAMRVDGRRVGIVLNAPSAADARDLLAASAPPAGGTR